MISLLVKIILEKIATDRVSDPNTSNLLTDPTQNGKLKDSLSTNVIQNVKECKMTKRKQKLRRPSFIVINSSTCVGMGWKMEKQQ